MFQLLKNKNLDIKFITSLIEITKISDIENWFIVYEKMDTGLDQNGTHTLDCTYVFTNLLKTEVVIYFSQFDNSLEIFKNIEIVPFLEALKGNILFDEIKKQKICEKIKDFELFYLNDKLSKKLPDRKIPNIINKI